MVPRTPVNGAEHINHHQKGDIFITLHCVSYAQPITEQKLFLLTAKSVNLVVPCDGFLCIMEIVFVFHSGYIDYSKGECNTKEDTGKYMKNTLQYAKRHLLG